MEQIIKFGISNYLQLCVEAGFSQIQSQFKFFIILVYNSITTQVHAAIQLCICLHKFLQSTKIHQ